MAGIWVWCAVGAPAACSRCLQAGNRVDVIWRARIDEHLGMMQVEPVSFAAARLIEQPVALYGLQLAAAHLRLLPERDPHAEPL